MSEFPLWSDLIAQEEPAKLQEMYPSPLDKGNPAPWMVSEDEMTDAQMKRREEIVKSMKDKEQDFKDRYGDRWKEVMYATATKQAMSEAAGDTEYHAYFRAMLKKHGYDSPADIPDDKKDDFFNAVDAGYKAKSESRLAEAQETILKPGAPVRIPHRGKLVSGKVIRYDNGKPHFSPFYVVNVGEYASVTVPAHAITTKLWPGVESRLAEAAVKPTFAVVAIDDPSPAWKQGYGHTPQQKVVWQMWGLDKREVVLAAKMAREKHPKATVSVENEGGRIVKVFKPGQAIHETKLTEVNVSKEGWASQSSHQYGATAVDTQEDHDEEPAAESDDQEMMSAQLDSLAQKSATLHDILQHVALGDVPAWIQTKVANADKDVSAILDYMKYEEAEPVAEATNADAMVPLRMQAAMVIAKSLGTVKGSGQSVDLRVSGGTPESIVNQAIRVWLSGSHTNEGWALGAKMLKLAKSMGIKWDEKLVRQKLAPITLKKLGLDEAEASSGPSPEEKLRQRQAQEKAALEIRQEREKMALQQRAANDKIQKQQQKQAEVQRKKQQ